MFVRPRVATTDPSGDHPTRVRDRAVSRGATSHRLSTKQNFIWILPANLISAGSQWAIVVLLAKIANVDVVGQFALATAVAVPITFLADFRLRVLFVTDSAEKWPFREILSLRLLLCCLSSIVILAVCFTLRYHGATTLLTLLVGCAYIVDCLSDTYYARLQRDERLDRVATSMITRNLIGIAAFTVLLYCTGRLFWGVLGLVLGRATILLLYDTRSGTKYASGSAEHEQRFALRSRFGRFAPMWNVQRQKQMLWTAFPLAICAVLVSVNGYVPRYLLELFIGHRAVGLYTAINYLPAACFLAINAMGYAVFPRLSKLFASGNLTEFRILLLKVVGVYGAVGLAGLLLSAIAGRQILSLLYRPEYAQNVYLLRWLMVVGVINCLTTSMQCGLTAASEFRVQVPLFATVTLVSILGCALLIPHKGLLGAALAVLTSSIVQLSGSTFLLLRTMDRRLREMKTLSHAQHTPAV